MRERETVTMTNRDCEAMLMARDEADDSGGVIKPNDEISEDNYQAVKRSRWKKTSDWLSSGQAIYGLSQGCVLLKSCLQMIGKNFASVRPASNSNIIQMAATETSPVEAAIQQICQMLGDAEHESWTPVRALSGWRDDVVHPRPL